MRYLAIILLLIVACGGPGDSPGDIPDKPSACLAWDSIAGTWRVNIGGELWETVEPYMCINDLPVGTYESFIRAVDREDAPLRFQIEVAPEFIEIIPCEHEDHFGEPLIFEVKK